MATGSRITDVEAVPEDTTFLFTVDDDGDEREVLLVRAGGELLAWVNECQHFTHIALDKGSGAPMRNGEIVCANHGAMFDADSGKCTFGPCEGAVLEAVDVVVEDGGVYLADDRFEFVDVGPAEDDDLDLVSKSNVEF